ncbi:MAG: transglutaminase-like cysteine peptidase [Aeromonadaceae bacterium]|nr:transglutaminase-like cysteine peptidase [Aeromonadaceae bacterium]
MMMPRRLSAPRWTRLLTTVCLLPGLLFAVPLSPDDQVAVQTVTSFYGVRAGKRTQGWRELVVKSKQAHWDEQKALTEVNRFFNQLTFLNDVVLWGRNDYWAAPMEFLGAGGGDCEDYSIAKYFTLLELGVPDEKLRMVYVKSLTYQQFHMVVAYYPTPAAVPLILDNIDGIIKPATKRKDLVPVYSFNGSHLWLMKERGQGQLAGSSSRLALWNDLRTRFSREQLKRPKINLDD